MPKTHLALDELDQSKSLEQEDYKKQLKQYQLQLLNMQLQLRERKRSVVLVVEGPDGR